jgi:hypothetical protein
MKPQVQIPVFPKNKKGINSIAIYFLNNLFETDQFPESHKLTRLTQEEIVN